MASLFVEGYPIPALDGVVATHAYIVYKDDSGNEYVIRGGPSISGPDYGPIAITDNRLLANSEDARGSDTAAQRGQVQVRFLDGRNATDVYNLLLQLANEIGTQHIPYVPGLPFETANNSNSVVATLLQSVGITFSSVEPDPAGVTLAGFVGSNTIFSFDRVIHDTSGPDVIIGGTGNDKAYLGQGNDKFDGGAGDDTAIYAGNAVDYGITHNADGSWTVMNVRGSKIDGTDTLINLEHVQFKDTAFDLKANGIRNQSDLTFVIDTTGSMRGSIAAVQTAATDLIGTLFNGGTTDARVSVISLKDPYDGYSGDANAVILPFTTSTDLSARQTAAIDAINSLTASGGGDDAEADYSALMLALNGSIGEWRDSAAVRNIILFTDAPVKDTWLASQVNQLAANTNSTISTASYSVGAHGALAAVSLMSATTDIVTSVKIFTVALGSDSETATDLFRMAKSAGGEAYAAADESDLTKVLLDIISLPPDTTAPTVAITSSPHATSQPVQMLSGTVDTADAGLTVRVFDGTTQVGTAKVQLNGNWSVAVPLNTAGDHTFIAQATDAMGNTGVSNSIVLTFDGSAGQRGLLESLTPSQEIAGIYLGYFGRSPDVVGFQFWEQQYMAAIATGQSQNMVLQNIANLFSPQTETHGLYPFLGSTPLSPTDPVAVAGVNGLLTTIYANLFDRTPELTDVGLQFWATQILHGTTPLGESILYISNGATGDDANTLLNKVVVSSYFESASELVDDYSDVYYNLKLDEHAALLSVTSNPASVLASETVVDALLSGQASVMRGDIYDDWFTGGNAGGDIIFPGGGNNTITLGPTGHTSEHIYFGRMMDANGVVTVDPITDYRGVTQPGYWGNPSYSSTALTASTNADATTINNFTAGVGGDVVCFSYHAWGRGGTVNGTGVELGLISSDGTAIQQAGTEVRLIDGLSHTAPTGANILEVPGKYTDATALASAIGGADGHIILSGHGLNAHDDAHILVGYESGTSVNIADVHLNNLTNTAQADTMNMSIGASDIVVLIGVTITSIMPENVFITV